MTTSIATAATVGGEKPSDLSFTVTADRPRVTCCTPESALVGGPQFTLQVNGLNFTNGSIVRWNGAAKPMLYISSTKLNATIPASDISLPKIVDITVTTPGASGASNTVPFPITYGIPTIISISPSTVKAGSTGLWFSLIVTGSNFTSMSKIQWNGVNKTTTFSVGKLIAIISAVDASTPGLIPVRVYNPEPGGGISTPVIFTVYNPQPTVKTLTPSSMRVGSPGFGLTVTGTNFTRGSEVKVDGSSRSTAFISNTALTTTIPATDLTTARVLQVTVYSPTPGGGTSSSLPFTVTPDSPRMTCCTPESALVGGPPFILGVNGQDFMSGATVKWNGIAKETAFISQTRLSATIPASDLWTPKIVNITVANPGTSGTSNALQFPVMYGVPTIIGIAPTSGYAGRAALTLTVNGTNFTAASKVQWNGVNRTTALSAGKLSASIIASDINTPGFIPVTVYNPEPGGGISTQVIFTVENPQPTMTTFTPTTITAGNSTFNLTVSGTNFTLDSMVQWDGDARQTWYSSSTSLKAQILTGDIALAKMVNVSVKNNDKVSANKIFYVKNGVPTVTTISPTIIAKGNPDTNVTIRGTNFNTQSQVYWNGAATAWPTYFINGVGINLTVPATFFTQNVGSTAKVQVFNPAPGGGKSANLTLTIGNPIPAVTSLNPPGASVGSPQLTVQVLGTGFVAGSKVYWNGVAKTTKFISETKINATILATDLNIARNTSLTVQNPAPGASTSAPVSFRVTNGVPTITYITPMTAMASGPGLMLTVTGTNFTISSKLQLNGINRTTTLYGGKLSMRVTATDINMPRTVPVTVYNPTPGGGTSLPVSFIVQNPRPSITYISPTTKLHGAAAFNLTVVGVNFTAASRVQWNGNNRTTWFTSATSLKALVESIDIDSTGSNQVRVLNPAGTGDLFSANKSLTVT